MALAGGGWEAGGRRSDEDVVHAHAVMSAIMSSAPALAMSFAAEPAWMADAACREHPEIDFFPQRGAAQHPARQVCDACLVRDECLQFALAHDLDGIWGGLSRRQRRLRQAAARDGTARRGR